MAPPVDWLMNERKRKVQAALLGHAVHPILANAVHPILARSAASIELRHWTPEELSAVFSKLSMHGPNLQSFNFSSPGLISSFANLVLGGKEIKWMKAPPHFMESAANKGLALCVNTAGEWSLREDGYFCISHVWEEGIRADPDNRGIPLSHVRKIFSRIQQTGAEWIWLDGLAIPAANRALTLEEEELKIAIINNLANIYRRADAVVVFDALTMHLKSIDYVDVAVSLTCGKWMTRVWTFQEIFLARKALVITATGVVNFKDMGRKLRALCGLHQSIEQVFGTDDHPLNHVGPGEESSDKYEHLYLKFARLLFRDGEHPSVAQIAMACRNRMTGNDIDHARAFFPVLGLTWKSHYTREQGMALIYMHNEHNWYAKRMILMPGSPRLSVRPGWAPSYLTGLKGNPIDPDDPLGDIVWGKRGLTRDWYTYKVKSRSPTHKENGLLLELHGGDSEGEGVLCGIDLCVNERLESIEAYCEVIDRQSAYILSNQAICFPSGYDMAYNCMFVERYEESNNPNEAWVYLAAAVTAIQRPLESKTMRWLILHESPVASTVTTDVGRNDKAFSTTARMLSDEPSFHKDKSSLHVAADSNNGDTIRQLLATGKPVDCRDEKSWTPLHTAAFKGHITPVRVLLENGAEVDALDISGRSPLMIAADEGHNEICEALLKAGANINLSSTNAHCPLVQALITHHAVTVKLLLENGASPSKQNSYDFAPLLVASKDVECFDLLIAAGADPMEDLVGGSTVIHFASRAGNVAVIERLIALGVPVDLPEGLGMDDEGLRAGITPLFRAVEEQREEAVNLLLSHGADPNKPTTEKTWSAVLQAVQLGHYGIVKALLRHGADRRAVRIPEGQTALHIACKKGHRRLVRLLLQEGWDANAKDGAGETPLSLARKGGHSEIVEVLEKARK